MKFLPVDVIEFRKALMAANKAKLESFVIHEGLVRGLNEATNAAIFSEIQFSFSKEIQLGAVKLNELEKRMGLFGDDLIIEGEVNDANKVRRLTFRGKSSKVDFRCTDARLITYPKTNEDEAFAVVTLTKAEASLLSKGVKLIGGEELTLHIKRDGGVHIECADTNNDRFELDLEAKAEFIDEPGSLARTYDAGSKSSFLPMIDHLARDNDEVSLVFMRTGNISMKLYNLDMLAIPRIHTGD